MALAVSKSDPPLLPARRAAAARRDLGTPADGRALLSLIPPVKFDLVIVDEAHHVRNSDTWSHRVVKHLLDSAEAAVLISATPIQTASEDLRTLLRLLRPDTFVDNHDLRPDA